MEESGCWLPLRLVLAVAWVGAWGWGLSLKPSESSGRLKLASPTSSAAGPKWSLYLLPQVPGTPLVVPQQRGRGGGGGAAAFPRRRTRTARSLRRTRRAGAVARAYGGRGRG